MIDDIKTVLRISRSNDAFDTDIIDLIDAARHDLMLSGISSEKVQKDNDVYAMKDVDPLIKRAITVYVKANFGWDNPDIDRLQKSYDLLKMHLSLAGDYHAIS
jgi:uncharacterized phage protein (predicted DNA packaging)